MNRAARLARPTVAAALAVAAAAVAAGSVGAAPKTTNPEPLRQMTVVLAERGITLSLRSVVRGSLVHFKVRNTSKVPRDFFIAGYIVRSLPPGRTRTFQLQFLFRGKYKYYSTAHPGRKFTGVLTVT